MLIWIGPGNPPFIVGWGHYSCSLTRFNSCLVITVRYSWIFDTKPNRQLAPKGNLPEKKMTTNKEPREWGFHCGSSPGSFLWLIGLVFWSWKFAALNHARNDEELLPNHVKGSRQGLKKRQISTKLSKGPKGGHPLGSLSSRPSPNSQQPKGAECCSGRQGQSKNAQNRGVTGTMDPVKLSIFMLMPMKWWVILCFGGPYLGHLVTLFTLRLFLVKWEPAFGLCSTLHILECLKINSPRSNI